MLQYDYNFEFTWDADELHGTFLVKGVAWDSIFQISLYPLFVSHFAVYRYFVSYSESSSVNSGTSTVTIFVILFLLMTLQQYQSLQIEAALGEDNKKMVESMVERTITEALKINPRTEWINNFEFTWDADELHGTFLVKG